MKEIKNKIFPFIIALSALSVSASAAFYSVTGLSKLFVGASTQVMIMAGSLEIAKLVIASLLYQYWNELNKILRTYLVISSIVLILITSAGIYGYLSAAYQVTVNQSKSSDAQVELLETKKSNFTQQRDLYNNEKDNLIQGITQLQSGLVGNKTSYVDKRGNLIQSTNSTNTKSFNKQLDKSHTRQSEISSKLDVLNDSIFKLDTQIVETKASNDKAGELGPLIYLSTLTGITMDRIINYLLLVIIFVFDPLAIALVISANFAFSRLKNTNIIEPQIDPQVDDYWLDKDMMRSKDWYFGDDLSEDEFLSYNDNPHTIEDIKVIDEEILDFPSMQDDVVPQEENRILEDKKGFGTGNFRVRPPQNDNIIDYN